MRAIRILRNFHTRCGNVIQPAQWSLAPGCRASACPSESLWQGRPYIRHDGAALAWIAPGGGTLKVDMLKVDMLNERALANAIPRLVRSAIGPAAAKSSGHPKIFIADGQR